MSQSPNPETEDTANRQPHTGESADDATSNKSEADCQHDSWFNDDDDRCLKDLLPENVLAKHLTASYNPSPPDALAVAA